MKHSCQRLIIMAALAMTLTSVSAFAQATRTWVSGVGDDVNPCSRTAPCKTFPGAISKTATCGEIDALDPAGFGTITINKAITLDGGGTLASILNAGSVNGIIVNLTVADTCQGTVILRNLSINGVGTGLNGIRLIGSNVTNLHVEHCSIQRQSQRGIDISPTVNGSRVFLHHVDIRDSVGDGIGVSPLANDKVTFAAEDVRSRQNGGAGLHFANDAVGSVTHSQFEGNVIGVELDAATVHIGIADSVISENTANGLQVSGGVTTFIDRISVFNNSTGILNFGTVRGFFDNAVFGNGVDLGGAGTYTNVAHP